MVAVLDSLRTNTALVFEVWMMTSTRYWKNLCLFTLRASDTLSSIANYFLEWITLIASYCRALPRYLLQWILVVKVRVTLLGEYCLTAPRDGIAEGPLNLNAVPAIESNEDAVPPPEQDALTHANSMNSSSEYSSPSPSSTDHNDLPSVNRKEYREDNGRRAESKSSVETDIIVLEEPYRDGNADGLIDLCQATTIESDEDTVPPREKDASTDVNSIISSSEHSTPLESTEQNDLSSMTREDYRESNGNRTESKSSSEIDMTVLREPCHDNSAEEPVNLNPALSTESDQDFVPPRGGDTTTDVTSMTSSLEHSFTPPSSTDQNDLLSRIREEHREDNTSGAEAKSSTETDMTVLEEFYRDNNAKGPFNLNPAPAVGSDADTLPQRQKNASTDLNSISSSSEHWSITPSFTDHNDLPSVTREEYREDNGSGAQSKSSSKTDMTVLEEPYRGCNAAAPAIESDEDIVPLREKDALIDLNSMTSSLKHLCTPPSFTDQYHLSSITREEYQEDRGSGAKWKRSIETDMTVLEEPYHDENTEGSFNLNPAAATESDEDTMPPCEKDASTDLNSITSSSEDSSTPSSSTHQNDTPSMSREEYWEDNGSSAESTSSIEIEIIELEEPYSDSNAEGPFNLNAGQAIESDMDTVPPLEKDASTDHKSMTSSSESSSTPPSSTVQKDLPSMTRGEYREDNGSGAETKSSIETDITVLKEPHRYDNADGSLNLKSAPAIENDVDIVPLREKDDSTDFNSMTSSVKHSCTPPSSTDQNDLRSMTKEYQEDNGSGVEWKSSVETDMTVLEEPYHDKNVQGPLNVNPAAVTENEEDTVPPREKDASTNVNCMTPSLKHSSTPHSATDQSDLPSMTKKEYREDNGSVVESKSSVEADMTALKEPRRDDSAEGLLNLIPEPANENDEDTVPPRKKDSSTDVNSMTSSLKYSCTPPSPTDQSDLSSTTMKECREGDGDLKLMHGSRRCKTQVGALKVTFLASEWSSSKGGLSTINRELAILLGKRKEVRVTFLVPQFACNEEEKRSARRQNVFIIEAEKLTGYSDPLDWLSSPPRDHDIDIVLGHGAKLGKQAQLIRKYHNCKWIQVVHTVPEELGMFKEYPTAVSKGEEKKETEVDLCESADAVAAVGPKLTKAYSSYLRSSEKHQDIIQLTPSTFSEFSDVKQAAEEMDKFKVLTFGRGDPEDFSLKGYDISAKAIAELKDRSYCLIFVGAPEGKQDEVAKQLLKSEISKGQLAVRKFVQSKKVLKELFCEVDLCIMPSRAEGFGLTALEAMSAGLPILVSSNSGFGEALCTVPSGESCVVKSEEPKEWAKAIDGVRQKERSHRLREIQQLRAAYEERFSWERLCNTLLDKMQELVDDLHMERPSSVQNFDGEDRPTAPSCQSSLLVKCTEDIKRSGHHFFLPYDYQHKESSDAEWKTSNVTDNTALKKPYFDEMAEGPFNRSPGQSMERDEDTLPTRENDIILIDADTITTSLKPTSRNYATGFVKLRHLSTLPSPNFQNHPLSTARKCQRKDNGDLRCTSKNNHYETEEREACQIYKERPDAPICLTSLSVKCSEGLECSAHHSAVCQYNESSGVKSKSPSEVDITVFEEPYCDDNAEEPFNLNPEQAIESDGDNVPPHEKDVSPDLNNMTSEHLLAPPSLTDQNDLTSMTREEYWEDKSKVKSMYDTNLYETSDGAKNSKDIQRLEHQSFLPDDCQYNESSGTESECSSEADITVFEEPFRDDNAERPFNLKPAGAIESGGDTVPPLKKDASADVINLTSSSEHLSIPPSPTDQSDLPSTTWKECQENIGNAECMFDNDHCKAQDVGESSEDIERSEHPSLLPDDCQYNESSGAESKSSSGTDIAVFQKPYRDDNAEGPFNKNPAKAIDSDGYALPPRENDASADVNSMTPSSEQLFTPPSPTGQIDFLSVPWKEYREENGKVEHFYDNDHYETQHGGKCSEDIERLEHHSLLPDDCQYNESSGAESESSNEKDITVCEEPYSDDNAERPFNLNSATAIESDKETLPPREKDASIDVNSMTSPSEHLSIPLSSTYRNNLSFTRATRKGYREESGEVGCMVDNDLSETKEADHPLLLSINGKFYCALFSEDHDVIFSTFKGIPCGGADLIIIQKQKNWSEENLKDTIRQICGQNARLKKTNYIIVLRKREESLAQTLEECTPGGKAYTMFVARSDFPVEEFLETVGPGLIDVVEKDCVIFVGPPSKSATNWFVAETEQDLMRHIIELFVPPGGVVLEYGNLDAEVSSCLKPSVQRNVSLLSVYQDEEHISAFRQEAEALSHAAYGGSGSNDNEG